MSIYFLGVVINIFWLLSLNWQIFFGSCVLFVIRLSGSSLERSSLLQQLISSPSVCQVGPLEGSCLDRAVSTSWDQFISSIPKLSLLGLCGPSHASFQILLPFRSIPPLGMYTNCYWFFQSLIVHPSSPPNQLGKNIMPRVTSAACLSTAASVPTLALLTALGEAQAIAFLSAGTVLRREGSHRPEYCKQSKKADNNNPSYVSVPCTWMDISISSSA